MTRLTEIKLVAFDWDGTLMDSEAQIVSTMQQAISSLGLVGRSEDQIRNIIGLGLSEAVQTLYPEQGEELVRRLADEYRHHFLVNTEIAPPEMFAGAIATLDNLVKKGYFVAVATGKGRRGLDKALKVTGLDGVFHVTRCADETRSKPHPQMLYEIMDFVGVDPMQTVMVGDTEYDMLMAKNAGTHAVAVDYGVHSKERLLQCEPIAVLSGIEQLLHCLGEAD